MTLQELSALDAAAFEQALGGIFEHSPWVARGAYKHRPFATLHDLHAVMVNEVSTADSDTQLALIKAHPELASKAALTQFSNEEQRGAGLDACTAEEFALLHNLNRDYRDKFGFPFILAVKGLHRREIIDRFSARLHHSYDEEKAECLRQISRIAWLRLESMFKGEQ